MRKFVLTALVLMFFTALAFAGPPKVGPDAERQAHRQEMKAVKQAMREKKAAEVKAPPVKTGPTFWEKEGERSGLGTTGSNFGQFVRNLNPMPFFKTEQEKYEARKAAAAGAKR